MKVLVAEDEAKMARILHAGLAEEGYEVDLVNNGGDALQRAVFGSYDVVMLDVMLPVLDGFEVCRRLREQQVDTPILMVTARDGVPDRVRGLDAGADDYIVKPFAFDELLARLRALSRRAESQGRVLQTHGLVLDTSTHEVSRDGRPVRLTTTEFSMLRFLVEHENTVLTRERILAEVWGWDFHGSSNIVDVYVGYLRSKIGQESDPPLIHTVRGVGYVFRGED